jgi:hypothetical protein
MKILKVGYKPKTLMCTAVGTASDKHCSAACTVRGSVLQYRQCTELSALGKLVAIFKIFV